MTNPDPKVAEQLWLRAHEYLRRGNLAQAVRDLAGAFEILKAVKDPRMRQVHAKWVELHKMYAEEQKAGAGRVIDDGQAIKTKQAAAEAKANVGDLDGAIALYREICASQPQNELSRERLGELIAAKGRADELSGPKAAAPAAAPAAPAPAAAQVASAQPAPTPAPVAAQVASVQPAPAAPSVAQAAPVVDDVAFLESLIGQIAERRRPAP